MRCQCASRHISATTPTPASRLCSTLIPIRSLFADLNEAHKMRDTTEAIVILSTEHHTRMYISPCMCLCVCVRCCCCCCHWWWWEGNSLTATTIRVGQYRPCDHTVMPTYILQWLRVSIRSNSSRGKMFAPVCYGLSTNILLPLVCACT